MLKITGCPGPWRKTPCYLPYKVPKDASSQAAAVWLMSVEALSRAGQLRRLAVPGLCSSFDKPLPPFGLTIWPPQLSRITSARRGCACTAADQGSTVSPDWQRPSYSSRICLSAINRFKVLLYRPAPLPSQSTEARYSHSFAQYLCLTRTAATGDTAAILYGR